MDNAQWWIGKCARRRSDNQSLWSSHGVAWTDLDGRISVVTLPFYPKSSNDDNDNNNSTTTPPATQLDYQILPKQNELGEPIVGKTKTGTIVWSPHGRYLALAIQHLATNKFNIIPIADLIVQATPSRFNSRSPYLGISHVDAELKSYQEKMPTILWS